MQDEWIVVDELNNLVTRGYPSFSAAAEAARQSQSLAHSPDVEYFARSYEIWSREKAREDWARRMGRRSY